MGNLVTNGEGKVDVQMFQQISHMVTHIEVTGTKYASYITISVAGAQGEKVLNLLEEVWGKQGRRQTDPPPPKPIMKELRDIERRAREGAKGGGKGK